MCGGVPDRDYRADLSKNPADTSAHLGHPALHRPRHPLYEPRIVERRPRHGRDRPARADGVHPDVVRSPFDGKHLRELLDGALRARVGRLVEVLLGEGIAVDDEGATGGQVADCKAAAALLAHLPPTARVLHGDKGYDTDLIRRWVEANGTLPNIPPKANRIWKNCFSPVLYRARNAIERMFCRLKDFRRKGWL